MALIFPFRLTMLLVLAIDVKGLFGGMSRLNSDGSPMLFFINEKSYPIYIWIALVDTFL